MTSGKHFKFQGLVFLHDWRCLGWDGPASHFLDILDCRDKLIAVFDLLLHTVLLANRIFTLYLLHPMISHFHPVTVGL